MSITKNISRKSGYIAELVINYTDVTSGKIASASAFEAIDMPAGSIVDDVYICVDTLFNPTTSAVIEVGTSGTTNAFVASQNIFTGQATGGRAGAVTGKGYKFTTPGAIYAKYTDGGGTPTAGSLRIVVSFHYENSSEFVVET